MSAISQKLSRNFPLFNKLVPPIVGNLRQNVMIEKNMKSENKLQSSISNMTSKTHLNIKYGHFYCMSHFKAYFDMPIQGDSVVKHNWNRNIFDE